jgi:polysaccharide export outer membrane protein
MRKFVVVLALAAALPACGSMPSSGPTATQIKAASISQKATASYDIVDISPSVAEIVGRSVRQTAAGDFSKLTIRPANGIGVGDTLAITLYESASGGLFAGQAETGAAGMPQVQLPPQTVDRTGTISVPYAGSIKVIGLTPRQVQSRIVSRLSARAIEPQAIVSVVTNESRLVTVAGDVEKAGRIPLNTGAERLMDVLAVAGGAKGRPDDSYVRITRSTQTREMLLSRIVKSPKNNVRLQPGDQIFVYQNPQKYVALGASMTNSEVPFATDNLTLAEAIGRAGGLDDRRADPAGVFIFRYEDAGIYRRIGGDIGPGDGEVPVVYRLNLKQPDSFLAAQRFPIKNKDVVYFANSPSTELGKFLGLLGSGVGIAGTGTVTVVRVVQ